MTPRQANPDELKPEVINAALEKTKGDRGAAAALLGMPLGELAVFITETPALQGRWGKPESPMSEADILARELYVPPEKPTPEPDQFSHQDKQVALAFAQEDAKLLHGLEGFGLNAEESKLALGMQTFHNRMFTQSIEILGGGVTRTSIKLQIEVDKIAERLLTVRGMLDKPDATGENRDLLSKEEKRLMDSFIAIVDTSRQIAELGNRSAMTMALIRSRYSKKEGRGLSWTKMKKKFSSHGGGGANGSNGEIIDA